MSSASAVGHRLCVLGGSTPFTAALVEAIRAAPPAQPAGELRLYGRDPASLERVRRYAEARLGGLGWRASLHLELEQVLEGASVVVNQIRYGDLAGRARDERLAQQFDLPADETLGPCGLISALRVVPRARELAQTLRRTCPEAWVLNLSNPLSVVTAAMVRAGAPSRCVGLCELPASTVAEACRLLGMDSAEVSFDYVGLNHRGFIHSLRYRGEEILSRLPALLGDRTVFGITAGEMEETCALPLKYFQLLRSAPASTAGRAQFLMELKADLAQELDTHPEEPPPSLARRRLDWYEGAVVPMLGALAENVGRRLVLNAMCADQLVWELPAEVWQQGLKMDAPEVPASVRPWLGRWVEHERAVLAATEHPDLPHLERALALDPTVSPGKVKALAAAIGANHEE